MDPKAISDQHQELLTYIRSVFGEGDIPLHRPVFAGRERQYLTECIDSNFVSSVGERVSEFEREVASYVGQAFGIATVNGTAALHVALALVGVESGDEVLTQALTFVATANAISYLGASPVFIDVDDDTLGLSPVSLRRWLEQNAVNSAKQIINKNTGARISACVPMHCFGIPGRIAELVEVCNEYGIPVIEDAAESLGSTVAGKHTGAFGVLATHSFNGNKVITTGGGGMITTSDEHLAHRAKHLTTTAKHPHRWEFVHDELGYNYRMPNVNAAIGVAQMEALPSILQIKAEVAEGYRQFCSNNEIRFLDGLPGSAPNFWLNAVAFEGIEQREAFLSMSNDNGVMCRPIWRLMTELPMYRHCEHDGLERSRWLVDRVVNLPSSVPDSQIERIQI